MSTLMSRHGRITVSGQVDQPPVCTTSKKIDCLCTPRRLAYEGKSVAVSDGIDRARFARVGTTCECDLTSDVRWKLMRIVCGSNEMRACEERHRSLLSRLKLAREKTGTIQCRLPA